MKCSYLVSVIIFLCSCTSIEPSAIEINETDLSDHQVYSFVGKKISVDEFEPEIMKGYILMDLAFIATYEVIEQYSGKKLPERIQFEVYDHYGYPPFAKHETVLIYLKKGSGVLYHVKYSYDLVRKSTKYGWVTCDTVLNWDEKPILKPVYISQDGGCSKGNIANNVAKVRIQSGDVD